MEEVEMSPVRYMCSLYGSQNCPLSGTCGMIYDLCPLCEKQDLPGTDERSRDELLK